MSRPTLAILLGSAQFVAGCAATMTGEDMDTLERPFVPRSSIQVESVRVALGSDEFEWEHRHRRSRFLRSDQERQIEEAETIAITREAVAAGLRASGFVMDDERAPEVFLSVEVERMDLSTRSLGPSATLGSRRADVRLRLVLRSASDPPTVLASGRHDGQVFFAGSDVSREAESERVLFHGQEPEPRHWAVRAALHEFLLASSDVLGAASSGSR